MIKIFVLESFISKTCRLLIAFFLVISCKEKEELPQEPAITIVAEKVGDTEVKITWAAVTGITEYKVWRTNNISTDKTPQLLATLTATLYTDINLPVSTSLSYYVTIMSGGKEIKSNVVDVSGQPSLPTILITAKNQSGASIVVEWKAEPSTLYKVWRIDNTLASKVAVLLGTNTDGFFIDDNPPVSTSLSFYVTASINGKDVTSNTVNVAGRSVLPISPYQMMLIPGTTLAVVRQYSSMVIVDYALSTIVKQRDFPTKIGQFDMRLYGGIYEAYVPCLDGKIYILRADNLQTVETIQTNTNPFAVAVNSAGKIFCSGSPPIVTTNNIVVYNRADLTALPSIPAPMDCTLHIQDDSHLVVLTTHLSPASMYYYILDANAQFVSRTEIYDSNWPFAPNGSPTRVSASLIVTATDGYIYTANSTMTFVHKITTGGSRKSDFVFSADGNTIYSAITDSKFLVKTTVTGGVASSTNVITKGYPWMLARDGNVLVVLSSPTSFLISSTSNAVFVEKLTLP